MLGTSDAWLMSRSSHRPRDPAYYIEDCRFSNVEVFCNSSECVASFDITFLMFDINFIIIVNYKETYENFNICCTDGTYYPHFMDVPLCQNAWKRGCLD
jgi:hypothetical protein